jgi:ankyrin repeat protein
MNFRKKYMSRIIVLLSIINIHNLYTASLDIYDSIEERNFALITAVYNLNFSDVQRLLSNGIDINIVNVAGETPLIIASQHGSIEMVTLLLQYGANKNLRDNQGRTALDWADLSRADNQILHQNGANYRYEEYSEIINLLS